MENHKVIIDLNSIPEHDNLHLILLDGTTPVAEYGYLYNWYSTVNAKNIAASGWHMPTDAEWTTLTDWLIANGYGYGGSGDDIGKAVASGSLWTAYTLAGTIGNDQGSNNSSGLNMKPGGFRYSTFVNLHDKGNFWTGSDASGAGWARTIEYNSQFVGRTTFNYYFGLSVRLIKDNDTLTTYTGNDGKTYATVKLGNQVWMAENLKELLYRDTTPIPEITDATDWGNDITGARCSYDYDNKHLILLDLMAMPTPTPTPTPTTTPGLTPTPTPTPSETPVPTPTSTPTPTPTNTPTPTPTNTPTPTPTPTATPITEDYGYLYNWYAATNAANIAASGWHAPKDDDGNLDWITLTTWLGDNGYGYGGDSSKIGKSMASTSLWGADGTGGNVGNDQGSNNGSGFNGKPAGSRNDDGTFDTLGYHSHWWNTKEYYTSYPGTVCLFNNYSTVPMLSANPITALGNSIRLLRDSATGWNPGDLYTGNDGKTYTTVKIGNQVWMSENLKETKYRDTTDIPNITNNAAWTADTTGAWCTYNNV